MKNKIYYIILTFLVLSFSAQGSVQQSFKIEDQSGSFTVRFCAVASELNIGASVGFSPVELLEWNQFNCDVRFSPEGTLMVRNGGTYDADATINYINGKPYWFQMDIDVAAKTYSVKVTEPGGIEWVLAQDYAFRDDVYTGMISYFSTKIESDDPDHFIGISSFQIGSEDDTDGHDNFNIPLETLSGDFFIKLEATPSHDIMNIPFGFSNIKVTDWGDYNIIVGFGGGGTLTARNGSVYESVDEVSYKAGESYLFFIEGSTTTKMYSVFVVTPDGEQFTIAKNYAFRLDNASGESIEYLGLHAVLSAAEGSYLMIDGIETGTLNYDGINPVTNQMIPEQNSVFSHTTVVTPSSDTMNAVVSLNQAEATAWSDLNAMVLFSSTGVLTVRNDNIYDADLEYPYKGGEAFQITFNIDLTTDMYSVDIRRSPHEETVRLATDYTMRSAPVETIGFLSTKTMWDDNNDGIYGSYLKLSNIGITKRMVEEIPFVNTAPTVDQLEDMTIARGTESEIVYLTNLTDGDGGIHAVNVLAESSESDVATVEVDNFGGNIWLLRLNALTIGSTTITVDITDLGGTANDGNNHTIVQFTVTVEASSEVARDIFEEIKVYPNPAMDLVHINGPAELERFVLYNLTGNKLQETNIKGNEESVMNLTNYPSGMYILKFYDNENKLLGVSRLVKSR